MSSPLKDWIELDGALLRLRLARPKANIVDAAMIAALDGALLAHRANGALRGVLLDGEGPNFSFGASVEEHLPAQCAQMLASLHALIVNMVEFPAPILVAVRGQCLGGGLEVALAGGPIFAAPDAQFGQPEMKLGVFAPAASVLLPYRVNQPFAEDLLFSGRSIGADEARAAGLVHTVFDDPETAAEVEALVAREEARGVPANRIVLAGFSQGCAITLGAALRQPRRLAGLVGLSGYLPLAAATAAERDAANAATPVLLAHGTRDPMVDIARGRAGRDAVAGLGNPVEWHEYPMEHSVCMEEVQALQQWLRRCLG